MQESEELSNLTEVTNASQPDNGSEVIAEDETMITLTQQQEASIIADAKADLVSHLIKTRGKDLELLESVEVSGILRMDRRTWERLIPRVVIAPGVYRYQMADIVAFIESRKEKP